MLKKSTHKDNFVKDIPNFHEKLSPLEIIKSKTPMSGPTTNGKVLKYDKFWSNVQL